MDNEILFETDYLRYVISKDGRNLKFTEKSTGRNTLKHKDSYFSKIKLKDNKVLYPEKASYNAPYLTVCYKEGFKAEFKVTEHPGYITFALKSVNGKDFWSIVMIQIQVNINYKKDDSFVATCMGMSLNTRMQEYPGQNTNLHSEAYTHIGIGGVKCAIIGAPGDKINKIMKGVLEEIPEGEMPKAAYSGPYALQCKDAKRTYTIGGASTIEGVDEYVNDMKQFGITQVHMHQGKLYTQGDFKVNCPNGAIELKKMIKRYHEHDIQVMLHTYTFFVDNWNKSVGNKYIAPIPHKDLGICKTFTLADDIDSKTDLITVEESTSNMKDVFGYNEPAAPIIRIDDELIRIETISKNKPFGFKKCIRGALGTIPSKHKKGVRVGQLNSYFGYIAPGKNSELFYEIARNTAEFYNEFDFDGFYLDAIDGVFVLDGNEFSWYHAVAFINELFKHIKKPPVFNCCYGPQYPGQWYARTRMGAFDSATRGYRDYADAHVAFNEKYAERMYLTGELGWWSLFPKVDENLGRQNKIMYDEDVDYICSKMLATDACMCWHGGFVNYKKIPMLAGYRDKIMLYTKLKEADYFPQKVKDKVRKPECEFGLIKTKEGKYRFRKTHTYRKRIESFKNNCNTFTFVNKFKKQQPKIRIEALYTTEDYDSENSVQILNLNENQKLKLNHTFKVDRLNISDKKGISVWFYGDGKGEIVNIRLRSPSHVKRGYADHFIKVDFKGWREFSFYEFQNCEMSNKDWPPKQMDYKVFTDVTSFYAVYSFGVDFSNISYIDILVNKKGDYDVYMKPIVAIPHRKLTFKNPSVMINKQLITFKTRLDSNTFLEYSPKDGDCKVYDKTGHLLDTPKVIGCSPVLDAGENKVTFNADCSSPYQKRAAVTLRTTGKII